MAAAVASQPRHEPQSNSSSSMAASNYDTEGTASPNDVRVDMEPKHTQNIGGIYRATDHSGADVPRGRAAPSTTDLSGKQQQVQTASIADEESILEGESGGNENQSGSVEADARRGQPVWKVWNGQNRFWCSGRIMTGPDLRNLLITVVLIIVPTVLFLAFPAIDLINWGYNSAPGAAGSWAFIVELVLLIITLALLAAAALVDPGIIPPNPQESAYRFRPRLQEIVVNGVHTQLKYCDTCNISRPPRAIHCSICNQCMDTFDHHCVAGSTLVTRADGTSATIDSFAVDGGAQVLSYSSHDAVLVRNDDQLSITCVDGVTLIADNTSSATIPALSPEVDSVDTWRATVKAHADSGYRLLSACEHYETAGNTQHEVIPHSVSADHQTALLPKGIRRCVEVTLLDGRTLRCTPEHRVMCADGFYRPAEQLDGCEVLCGLTGPLSEPIDNQWQLNAGLLSLRKDEALAFARLLGRVMSSGASRSDISQLSLGFALPIDMAAAQRDVALICRDAKADPIVDAAAEFNARFVLNLPHQLGEALCDTVNSPFDGHSILTSDLPEELFDGLTPIQFVREFLGGLLGHAGSTPYFNQQRDTFAMPTLCIFTAPLSTAGDGERMTQRLQRLIELFKMVGIESLKARLTEHNGVNQLWRAELYFESADDTNNNQLLTHLKHVHDLVGYRYSSNKQWRISLINSYISLYTSGMGEKKAATKRARSLVRSGLSKSSASQRVRAWLSVAFGGASKHLDKTTVSCGELFDENDLPRVQPFCQLIGVQPDFFDVVDGSDMTDSNIQIDCDAPKQLVALSTYRMPVRQVCAVAAEPVFDVTVLNNHSFIANGVTVHNCPWLGTCVAKNNYRSFTLFLYSLSALACFTLGVCIYHMIYLTDIYTYRMGYTDRLNAFASVLGRNPISLIVAAYVFIAMFFVLGLCGFHTFLTCRGQTTNEQLKRSFPHGSPNSNGCIENFARLFCRTPSSLLDAQQTFEPGKAASRRSAGPVVVRPMTDDQIGKLAEKAYESGRPPWNAANNRIASLTRQQGGSANASLQGSRVGSVDYGRHTRHGSVEMGMVPEYDTGVLPVQPSPRVLNYAAITTPRGSASGTNSSPHRRSRSVVDAASMAVAPIEEEVVGPRHSRAPSLSIIVPDVVEPKQLESRSALQSPLHERGPSLSQVNLHSPNNISFVGLNESRSARQSQQDKELDDAVRERSIFQSPLLHSRTNSVAALQNFNLSGDVSPQHHRRTSSTYSSSGVHSQHGPHSTDSANMTPRSAAQLELKRKSLTPKGEMRAGFMSPEPLLPVNSSRNSSRRGSLSLTAGQLLSDPTSNFQL